LIPVARDQRPDQRSVDARDAFAHQPFGASGFAGGNRFINAAMIVVAARLRSMTAFASEGCPVAKFSPIDANGAVVAPTARIGRRTH
jgi:hypothetical protein